MGCAGIRAGLLAADVDVWGKLEAGGRFGIDLSVYLPYYALSLPLVAVVIVSFFPRPDRMFPVAGAIGLTGLFAFWIFVNDPLLVAQPELATYAIDGLGLTAAAAVFLLTAHHLKAHPAT